MTSARGILRARFRPLSYLSVCSGIEAATVAWRGLGWTPTAVAEIDRFPSAVLAHHYPNVPNLGSIERFHEWPDLKSDVLVGGTPCQAFSVAGLRRGLSDPRGNLALVYLGILDRFRPRWAVWENVPGVLSSNGGRDFGAFLGALVELGYGLAYRILDAQFCGVPQRRRRVFVVAHLGDWRGPAAVLFERGGLRGDLASRPEARKEVAGTLTASSGGPNEEQAAQGRLIVHSTGAGFWSEGAGTLRARTQESHEHLVVQRTAFGGNNTSGPIGVSTALNAHGGPYGRLDFESETFIVEEPMTFDTTQITNPENRCQPRPGAPAHPLAATAHPPAVVYSVGLGSDPLHNRNITGPLTTRNGDPGIIAFTCKDHGGDAGAVAPTLRAMGHSDSHANGGGQIAMASESVVRRLTPLECERLQGFPDDYTLIPYKGKSAERCPDGPRYKALGNSMAVPVMRWIGEGIQSVDRLMVGLVR